MSDFVISLNDAEVKAMLSDVLDIQEWIQNAASNKARRCVDSILESAGTANRNTDINTKHSLILDMQIETALERQNRLLQI